VLVDWVAAFGQRWQQEDLLLDVGRQVQEVHDLRHPRLGDVGHPGHLGRLQVDPAGRDLVEFLIPRIIAGTNQTEDLVGVCERKGLEPRKTRHLLRQLYQAGICADLLDAVVRELVEVKISGTPERPIFEARPLRSVRAVWDTLFGRGGN
jgi:hypothetical protein